MSSLIHFFPLLLLLSVRSVWPQSICSNPSLPYKTETNYDCSNFDKICLKQDDRQCSNFLNICAQCPPSNYSTIMLRDIVKMIADLNSKYATINDKTVDIHTKYLTINDKTVEINSKVSTISHKTDSVVTIGIFIIIILIILVLVLLLENRFKLITKCCGYICGDKNLRKEYKILQSRNYNDNRNSFMTFQMEGESQTIELYIKNMDRIVDVKKRICDKLENGIDFKSLRLKFNGKILDDNQYLLPAVWSRRLFVNCVLDNVAAAEFDENHVSFESGRVVLYSMFDESGRLEIEYSNVDKVSSIVENISKKFGIDSKDIILFINDQHLIEDKCIFEYDINVNSKILFYYPVKLNEKALVNNIDRDPSYPLYRGFDKQRKILTKFYKDSMETHLVREYFIEELINYQKLKSLPIFVRVFGIQKSENVVKVVMENMSEGSLNMLLKTNRKFSENDIHGYLKQIMEALKYLHDKGIPYGSLTPYNIFVDGDKNIKLSSFNLSKYVYRNDLNKELQIQFKKTGPSVSYVAPEIRMKKPCDKWSDVWSLGVILIGFVNGALTEITVNDDTNEVSYKLKNTVSDQLKAFIEACLKYDPNQRPTIDQLMNHEFFKQYQ